MTAPVPAGAAPPSSLRILCVADEYPWPAVNGYRLRLAAVVEALAGLGEVDLFVAVGGGRDPEDCVPPSGLVARQLVVTQHERARTAATWWGWLTGSQPRRLYWADWGAARRALAQFGAPRYDCVWYAHLDSWEGFGGIASGRSVVDLDNLEDEKLRALRRATGWGPGSAASRPSEAPRRAIDRVDERRWGRRQRAAATMVDRVVVCSELDRRRLGVANCDVVANGYEPPGGPMPIVSERRPAGPVLTLVALFSYEPNADAARWFVHDVLPAVRSRHPDASFQVVGRWPDPVPGWLDAPGVDTVGEVADVRPFLERSDVCVAPVRYGSGTRVKILEAFAHGVPVVATTLGAEGIDARPGLDILLADDHTAFARACCRLLDEPELAVRMGAAGHDLWARRYRREPTLVAVRSVVTQGLATAPIDEDSRLGGPPAV
jgi:glycosyltransferase involved in cell wall biosynthesis